MTSARSQADSISSTGQAEAERELAATRAELDRLRRRRDAITTSSTSLRDVVAGFGDDD